MYESVLISIHFSSIDQPTNQPANLRLFNININTSVSLSIDMPLLVVARFTTSPGHLAGGGDVGVMTPR